MKLTLTESMELSRKLAARVVAQAAEIRELRAFIERARIRTPSKFAEAAAREASGDTGPRPMWAQLEDRVSQLERTTAVLNGWRNACVGRQRGRSRK